MGSRDLRRIYLIDPKTWEVLDEKEPPGIPWAAVATNGTLRFTIGEGPNDDRYIRRFVPELGFSEADKIACPEFTGSYLSYDGENLLSKSMVQTSHSQAGREWQYRSRYRRRCGGVRSCVC